MEVRRRRKIRISFSDPDATDSDSGEDSSSTSCGKINIVILHHCGSSSNASAKTKKKNPSACGGSAAPMPKRFRGVYERQPCRWAAEFRSHRLKARHWIGTFATKEEARAAYDDFERQFVKWPSRCSGLALPPPPPALERRGRAAAVHRASHPQRQRRPHPPDETEKRQIVLALPAPGIKLPPPSLPSAPANAPSTSVSPPPVPPTPIKNARPSVHSFWADEPAYENFLGLPDLRHLPLPFTDDGDDDGSMEFDTIMDIDSVDFSLFDDFLRPTV